MTPACVPVLLRRARRERERHRIRDLAASIKAGGEYVGMEPSYLRPRSGIPHTTRRRRVTALGDVTVPEAAACHNRYHAACSARSRAEILQPRSICAKFARKDFRQDRQARVGNTRADVHNANPGHRRQERFHSRLSKRTPAAASASRSPDWGEATSQLVPRRRRPARTGHGVPGDHCANTTSGRCGE